MLKHWKKSPPWRFLQPKVVDFNIVFFNQQIKISTYPQFAIKQVKWEIKKGTVKEKSFSKWHKFHHEPVIHHRNPTASPTQWSHRCDIINDLCGRFETDLSCSHIPNSLTAHSLFSHKENKRGDQLQQKSPDRNNFRQPEVMNANVFRGME